MRPNLRSFVSELEKFAVSVKWVKNMTERGLLSRMAAHPLDAIEGSTHAAQAAARFEKKQIATWKPVQDLVGPDAIELEGLTPPADVKRLQEASRMSEKYNAARKTAKGLEELEAPPSAEEIAEFGPGLEKAFKAFKRVAPNGIPEARARKFVNEFRISEAKKAPN